MSAADSELDRDRMRLLDDAIAHLGSRECWNAYPEMPSEKIFGEGSKARAQQAFEQLCGAPFELPGHAAGATVGGERSPYGFELDVTYPAGAPAELLERAQVATEAWCATTLDARLNVLLGALEQLREQSLLGALAVMHTTGQGYMMAFQAGAAHALDRALEATAQAAVLLRAVPGSVRWAKPMGSKRPPAEQDKTYAIRPRGVALVIGCNTFPTWNGLPGLFASLACGCPVIVKPHPSARLPLALAVRALREQLAQAGLPADAVQLAADDATKPVALALAQDPAVKVIDYTGSSSFGAELVAAAPQARIYAEQSGCNSVLIDEFADRAGMVRNLSLALSLYSGQMCTAPQNIFIVKEHFDAVAAELASGINALLGDDARAVEILGAIASEATVQRIDDARDDGDIMLDSRKITHAEFAAATVRTPLLVKAPATSDRWRQERFGPIAYLIPVNDATQGITLVSELAATAGSLTASLYSDDEQVQQSFALACAQGAVSAGINLTGPLLMNHSSAFSDYHGSGASPAASACFADAGFITSRYYVAQLRRDHAA